MSPKATLPVEDQGGLSVDQIHIAIDGKALELERTWAKRMDDYDEKLDTKLSAHADRLDKRLDLNIEKVDGRFEKTEAKIDATLEKVTELIHLVHTNEQSRLDSTESQKAIQEEWHDEDLSYRASVTEWQDKQEPLIIATRADVTTNQLTLLDVNTKLNIINWFVLFCKGFTSTGDAVVTVAERGKKISSALAAIFGFILVLWQTFRHNGMLDSFIHWSQWLLSGRK